MDKIKKTNELYKTTEIWQHFSTIATKDNQTNIEKLVDNASAILDRIIETFPTYTLHNGQHQLNILNLYEKILGEKLKILTDLECAFLILGAFYHDIGMVFKESERNNLEGEEYFSDFLEENDRAKLLIEEQNGINNETAEWYCRWSHAKRVWKYLDPINENLVWENTNIRKELAEVCLSHNEGVDYIKEKNIPSDFWNKSDLKFCAIILRLADILDFDDTRTPVSTYQFLGLDNPQTDSETLSQKEWQKHFASKGFTFDNWNQTNNYTIKFQAAPNSPSIEHDINIFLNSIERELSECYSILRFCSDKWKDFKLPEKIDRQNIVSQGYTFGDFKFSLDQQQVLSILMGENLYDNKFVFIRELIQNAIDTSRHRKFYEISRGNSNFIPDQVNVSTWHDSEGYRWIRVDDFGMGITFEQVSKYFLKVGCSYYNSDEFKVEKLSYRNKEDFTPVSRFGIGILSCFIVGDLVEVNTNSIFSNKKDIHPIRLSLKGLYNYYVMQTNKDIPFEMPCNNGSDKGYRKEKGTSVAVRIKPNMDLLDFDLSKELDYILFNPEVPINLIGKGIKGNYLKDGDTIKNKVINHSISKEKKLEILLNLNQSNIISIDPKIEIHTINLNNHYSHPFIKGVLYAFIFQLNEKMETENDKIEKEIRLSFYNSHFDNRFISNRQNADLSISIGDGIDEMIQSIKLNNLLETFEIFNEKPKLNNLFDSIVLSHNGIMIPNKRDPKIELHLKYYKNIEIIGYIELTDKFRPNLSAARNNIISIPWFMWSGLNYTIRKNLPQEFSQINTIDFTGYRSPAITIDNDELNQDQLLLNKKYWPSEKIFNHKSLVEILDSNADFDVIFNRNSDLEDLLRKKLIELYCRYKIIIFKKIVSEGKLEIVKKSSITKLNSDALSKPDYLPLTFCEYDNFKGLMPEKLNAYDAFNIEHPFSKWIIKSYIYLNKNYSNHLYILLNNNDISIVNTTLKKLRGYLPARYRPSENLYLTEDDFKVDFETIPFRDKFGHLY